MERDTKNVLMVKHSDIEESLETLEAAMLSAYLPEIGLKAFTTFSSVPLQIKLGFQWDMTNPSWTGRENMNDLKRTARGNESTPNRTNDLQELMMLYQTQPPSTSYWNQQQTAEQILQTNMLQRQIQNHRMNQLRLLQAEPLINIQNSLQLAANPNHDFLLDFLQQQQQQQQQQLLTTRSGTTHLLESAMIDPLSRASIRPNVNHPIVPNSLLDIQQMYGQHIMMRQLVMEEDGGLPRPSLDTPISAVEKETEHQEEQPERGKRDPCHAFPSRLHEILATPEYNDYIAWLPHGQAWKILNRKMFEKKVIPQHFRHARYASFMRQVNGWGFKRVTEGPDHNAYFHEYFLRDFPHISSKMQRPLELSAKQKSKKDKHRDASEKKTPCAP